MLITATSDTHFQEMFSGFGFGLFDSAKAKATEVKVTDFGYRLELCNGIYWQNKVAYWLDQSGDPRRKNSFYLSTGLGMLVDLKPIEIRVGTNLGFLASRDSYLGGHFPQFNEELYVGVRDKRGNGIGVKIEHISSAGFSQPNQGRDFVMLELSSKW